MVAADRLSLAGHVQNVREKFADLRAFFQEDVLDAYLIPSADEHLNEYLPAAKQRRVWVSGFTGSAGDLLLGRQQAWLFVDSRYYEQADLEVDAGLIQVCKVGLDDHKTLEETLEALGKAATEKGKAFRLGLDPFTLSVSQYRELKKRLEPWGVALISLHQNLVDRVRLLDFWSERDPIPAIAHSKVFAVPADLTGETVAGKLTRVREEMAKKNTQILPVTKLDQIAWLFNLRGWDIPYNPVFIAYALVTTDQAWLFTNIDRIEPAIREDLAAHVTLLPYEQYGDTVRSLISQLSPCRVLLDPRRSTMGTYELVNAQSHKGKIVEADNPIEGMKARKNEVELAQMQQANLKASCAKTRTLKWLADELAAGHSLTEADVAAAIERFYAAAAGFQGLSFNTIAGAGANSSIVHYGTPDPKRTLQPGDLLLLDSGAQYAAGTTDDTRTVVIGEPTPAQIERYTEVLKAHINCAMQRFPKGTTGAQLDGITRSTLWFAGLDYGHGTGHGVGTFLNVHEGPNGISKRVNEALSPGMVTSVEPGYYEPEWGGIRLENLYVVKDLAATTPSDAGQQLTPNQPTDDKPKMSWYGLESLTYIPFDNRLIDLNRLDARQRQWLTAYYQAIVEKLSSYLTQEEMTWLEATCNLA